MHPALESLRTDQRQLDADGVEVGVSRQAVDETLVLVMAMKQTLEACEEFLAPQGFGKTLLAEIRGVLAFVKQQAREGSDETVDEFMARVTRNIHANSEWRNAKARGEKPQ